MTETSTAHWSAEVAVGHSLYPEVKAAQAQLQHALNQEAGAIGLPPPPVAVSLDKELSARGFLIRAAGSSGPAAEEAGLPAGARLVRNTPLFVRTQFENEVPPLDVQGWPDPLQPSRVASIVYDAPLKSIQRLVGGLVLNAADVVELRLVFWLRSTAADALNDATAKRVVAQLAPRDADALLRVCPIDALTSVLKSLLRDGLPLRDFETIALFLADEGHVHWSDAGSVTSALPGRLVIPASRPHDDTERRFVIARMVTVPRTLRQRAGNESLQVWTLDEIEGWTPGDDPGIGDIAYFEAQLIEQSRSIATADRAVVITSPMRRAFVAEKLRPHAPELMVVGRHELPRGIALQPRGRIRITPPPPPAPRRFT